MGFFRPTFAEIDLGALIKNYRAAEACLAGEAGIVAMVKADAYGHGAVQVSKKLESEGVASLGVATIEEGLELRESGIKAPIIVMGGLMGMGEPACGTVVDAGLTPVVHTARVLEFLDAAARAAGKVIGIHLKIDTGMSRLGALPVSLDALLSVLKSCKGVRLDGVMTHFAEAEEDKYTACQMGIFNDAAGKIEEAVGTVPIWHVANSAAIIDGKTHLPTYTYGVKEGRWSWVRPGLMLYGAYPAPKYQKRISLEPVMTIKSIIAMIKTVPAGTNVSYNCTFTTKRKTLLGVIPIGYADGYPWSLSNKGMVLVGGRRAPVAGRVTMDMIVVDLTNLDTNVGDEVVLMGRQGGDAVTVDELAGLAGTISYEFFCGISKRMPRVYVD